MHCLLLAEVKAELDAVLKMTRGTDKSGGSLVGGVGQGGCRAGGSGGEVGQVRGAGLQGWSWQGGVGEPGAVQACRADAAGRGGAGGGVGHVGAAGRVALGRGGPGWGCWKGEYGDGVGRVGCRPGRLVLPGGWVSHSHAAPREAEPGSTPWLARARAPGWQQLLCSICSHLWAALGRPASMCTDHSLRPSAPCFNVY